ncbi:MAG: hypothetical protein A2Y95_11345 [Deltaproteobacteria bacterium RBG_13_65_10]|nr:MAG: hypothetical protein A2Y95_11345 [Deltaproteobacteria bacterium RBG_13_65_10]
MPGVGGRRPSAFLRDLAADVAGAVSRALRCFLHPASRRMRETLLAQALLLATIACAWPLGRGLHAALRLSHVASPLLSGLGFALAGIWAWRRRRSSDEGRAMLLTGGLGALAFLALAREWIGLPARLWQLPAFVLSAALVDATYEAARAETRPPLSSVMRRVIYAIPIALGIAILFLPRTAARVGEPPLAAGLLYALATAYGFGAGLVARFDRRAIGRRQRGKLLAAGHGVALGAILAGALVAHAGSPRWVLALPALAAAPLALAGVLASPELLWVDAFLARSLFALIVFPVAAMAAWVSSRAQGTAGWATTTILLLFAPAAWRRFEKLRARVFGRGDRRRVRALEALAREVRGSVEPARITAASRSCLEQAFPGVETALLADAGAAEGFCELVPGGARRTRLALAEEHPLCVFFRADTRPLTRYEVLVHPGFLGARKALLREMDEIRAAVILPCCQEETLYGLLVLGGQVRGGFFSVAELRDAERAASILGAALAGTRVLQDAASRIAALESALHEARVQVQVLREESARDAEDLDESTRQILKAYDELKTRSTETKEARARMASSGPLVLAGKVAGRVAAQIEAVIQEGETFLREHRPRAGGSQADKILARLAEARQSAHALDLLARGSAEGPSDLSDGIETVVGMLSRGWKGRISLDRKIEEVPPVAWPRGALLATLLHLLMNAEEAIEDRGSIAIGARLVKGSAMSVAEAEEKAPKEGLPLWNTDGKRAWASGAPRIELTIHDDGRGIRPEDHARLFHPFFTTRSAAPGALGLGLAAVADVLARHGGSIHVESEPHAGSTFIVELPTSARRASRPSRPDKG